jgi:hypothetical protein
MVSETLSGLWLRSRTLPTSGGSASLGALVLLIACGCGPSQQEDPNRSIVTGTVTFDGKPLPAGNITFESTEGPLSATAAIDKGVYSTSRAALGANEVSIETESMRIGFPAGYVKIPPKYADTATSGLTAEVKPGRNENANFDLTK